MGAPPTASAARLVVGSSAVVHVVASSGQSRSCCCFVDPIDAATNSSNLRSTSPLQALAPTVSIWSRSSFHLPPLTARPTALSSDLRPPGGVISGAIKSQTPWMAWEAAPDRSVTPPPFQPRDPRASRRSPQTASVVAHRNAASDMPSPSTSDVVRATDSASVRGASSATTVDAASSACGTALTDGADTNLSDVSESTCDSSLASSTTLSQSRKVACAGLPATPRSTRG
mmetsp:Transcript_20763/g.54102  ORF Transcript_20763/g.54102 Transcript_20763/m.54102 type:complete len:229 (-) Transcript_20763:144-830(-)